jgi:hypothetical protein
MRTCQQRRCQVWASNTLVASSVPRNAVFLDVTPRESSKKILGGTHRLHHHGGRNQRARQAIRSPETSVLKRATRRHIPEGATPNSHRRKNLKSYTSCPFASLYAPIILVPPSSPQLAAHLSTTVPSPPSSLSSYNSPNCIILQNNKGRSDLHGRSVVLQVPLSTCECLNQFL